MSEAEAAFDDEVDVLVVGAGSGGFVAALAAKARGLDVLLVEKSEFYGGSSAFSGGGAWIPNHPVLLRQGQRDDPKQIRLCCQIRLKDEGRVVLRVVEP